MGFRFNRRVKIVPGITLNFSKSGISTSIGPRGAKVTIGKNGIRKTVGIPGTGLSATEVTSWKTQKKDYVKCPYCGTLWKFDKRMIGEELICTCKNKFRLDSNRNTVTNTDTMWTVGCLVIVGLIVFLGYIGLTSCSGYKEQVKKEEKEKIERENFVPEWVKNDTHHIVCRQLNVPYQEPPKDIKVTRYTPASFSVESYVFKNPESTTDRTKIKFECYVKTPMRYKCEVSNLKVFE